MQLRFAAVDIEAARRGDPAEASSRVGGLAAKTLEELQFFASQESVLKTAGSDFRAAEQHASQCTARNLGSAARAANGLPAKAERAAVATAKLLCCDYSAHSHMLV